MANPRRRLLFLVLIPIAVSIFSQFEFVQQSTCRFGEWPLGLGQCDVLADLIAPAWALAIIPIAGRLRLVATRNGTPSTKSGSRFAGRDEARSIADLCARAAQWGAGLIVLLSWTREWERFNEQPDAVWLVLAILSVLGLLIVPVWWIRDELHTRGVRWMDTAPLPQRVDRFLFDEAKGKPARWAHVLAFCLVTIVVSFTILGQFDALLRGMHLPGDSGVGVSCLPNLLELDLSQKRDGAIETVHAWRAYTDAVGARFGSARDVVTAHVIVDTVLTIPAYLVGGIVLAAFAWRRRRSFHDRPDVRRAFELLTLVGLVLLVLSAGFDMGKNVFTWWVVDRAWTDPTQLTDANVRILWFFTLARTIGLVLLLGTCVLLLALAETATRRLRQALVAARFEIVVLGIFAFVLLTLPQIADVIRGWRVSHTMITLGLAIIWSMLIRWTSVTNLRLQHRHWSEVERSQTPEPPTIRVPRVRTTPTIGRVVVTTLVILAMLQLALDAIGLSVGQGLLIPAGLVVGFWIFGLPLPPSEFVRGNRPVDVQMRRRIPRTLGSIVYLIIGLAALKASAASIAYARHEDWWLFFALVPPLIGMWRIATRTTGRMGPLEAVFSAVMAALAASLYAAGDPALSPAALAFAGITFAYGSLAYFNSYERESLVNRMSVRFFTHTYAKPFVFSAVGGLVVVVVWFYAEPVAVAPRVGTIGMVVLAMMILTVLGAGAIRIAELTRPPRLLAAFGITRTPVVAFAIAWLLLAPGLADEHVTDIRRIDATEDRRDVLFDDVWSRWADANIPPEGTVSRAPTAGRTVVPLVLVSSSGGGLRAAAWTSFVLECVFERAPLDTDPCALDSPGDDLQRVAVMSGVSGGSLGIAAYAAHTIDGVEGPGASDSWVDVVLGDDYLAAPVGWLFFVDMPRALLGFGPGLSNRAELTERAWEASWPVSTPGLSRGIWDLWSSTDFPPIVFNGASVNDGCGVNISVLDAAGASPEVPACSGIGADAALSTGAFAATHDLVDFICPDEDIALSTAAGMSARFPIVSVAGRIAARDDDPCRGTADGAVFVADGGYLEGSGAGTLLDAWNALRDEVERHNASGAETCIVPFMIHIDNGYESPTITANESVPRESLVPLLATLNSSSGITVARAEAALAFERRFTIGGHPVEILARGSDQETRIVGSRYVRLVTRAHPGVQAPLSWTLSQASIDDLRDQLEIVENAAAFDEIRSWLDDDLVCLRG
jgi:hypothetical protein